MASKWSVYRAFISFRWSNNKNQVMDSSVNMLISTVSHGWKLWMHFKYSSQKTACVRLTQLFFTWDCNRELHRLKQMTENGISHYCLLDTSGYFLLETTTIVSESQPRMRALSLRFQILPMTPPPSAALEPQGSIWYRAELSSSAAWVSLLSPYLSIHAQEVCVYQAFLSMAIGVITRDGQYFLCSIIKS